MIRLFKRRRPMPVQENVTTQGDIITAHAWGLTLTQWWALSDFERAECRRNITVAPRFGLAS
jgi:hypothetical protein